jgi:MFS family permease
LGNPLINKDFALLAIGQFVSATGDQVHQIALLWWILDKTGSPAAMAALGMASLVPAMVLGPFLGVFADKLDRKWVVVWMDFARAVLIGTVAGLALCGTLKLWHLYAATVLASTASALFEPAVNALVPRIVPDSALKKSQAVQQGLNSMVGVYGPFLGGVLVGWVGISMVFLLNAISFFLSGVSEIFITYHHRVAQGRANPLLGVREGFRFIRKTRTLPWLMGMLACGNFALAPMGTILVPFMIREVLHQTARGLGLFFAFAGVGGVVGAVLAGGFQKSTQHHRAVIVFPTLQGLLLASWGLAPSVVWTYTMAFLIGICAPLAQVNINMVFFKLVPDEMRGKVFAFRMTFLLIITPVALSAYGAIASVWTSSIPYLVVASGAILAAVAQLMRLVPGFRDL